MRSPSTGTRSPIASCACYGRGRCSWPARGEAAGIKDYFVNPAYDMYPVVNIDWLRLRVLPAQGKRLPTEEEWLVAAVAAGDRTAFYISWGDVFGGGRLIRGRAVAVCRRWSEAIAPQGQPQRHGGDGRQRSRMDGHYR